MSMRTGGPSGRLRLHIQIQSNWGPHRPCRRHTTVLWPNPSPRRWGHRRLKKDYPSKTHFMSRTLCVSMQGNEVGTNVVCLDAILPGGCGDDLPDPGRRRRLKSSILVLVADHIARAIAVLGAGGYKVIAQTALAHLIDVERHHTLSDVIAGHGNFLRLAVRVIQIAGDAAFSTGFVLAGVVRFTARRVRGALSLGATHIVYPQCCASSSSGPQGHKFLHRPCPRMDCRQPHSSDRCRTLSFGVAGIVSSQLGQASAPGSQRSQMSLSLSITGVK